MAAGNCVAIANDVFVDLNGGYYRVNVSLSAGEANWGFINMGRGARDYNLDPTLEDTIIDIGFKIYL